MPEELSIFVTEKSNAMKIYTKTGDAGTTSLVGVLDATQTPMGARALRARIRRPLGRLGAIRSSLDSVSWLVGHRIALSTLRSALGKIRDMERLIARVGAGLGNGRDLNAIGASLEALPAVRMALSQSDDPGLARLSGAIADLPGTAALIRRAISDSPSATLKDGDVIRDGFNAELDEDRKSNV